MSDAPFTLLDGETTTLEISFLTGGFAGLLLKFLRPLMQQPSAEAAVLTNARIIRRGGGADVSVSIGDLERVYRNTSSDSFALVARERPRSLLLPRVENADVLAAALREAGVEVEDEVMSPKRRFMR